MWDQAWVRGGWVRGVHRDGLQGEQGGRQGGAPQHQRLSRPSGQHARWGHSEVFMIVCLMTSVY